jgi:hypothetical protein
MLWKCEQQTSTDWGDGDEIESTVTTEFKNFGTTKINSARGSPEINGKIGF